jgi:hypothetical protein
LEQIGDNEYGSRVTAGSMGERGHASMQAGLAVLRNTA